MWRVDIFRGFKNKTGKSRSSRMTDIFEAILIDRGYFVRQLLRVFHTSTYIRFPSGSSYTGRIGIYWNM